MTPYDPSKFVITIRAATEGECALTDGMANTTDGAGAVLVGDTLVAVANEYGTCIPLLHTKDHTVEFAEIVEQLLIHATDLFSMTTELESEDVNH